MATYSRRAQPAPSPVVMPVLLTPTELRKRAHEAARREACRGLPPAPIKHQFVASDGGWITRRDLKRVAALREKADVAAGRVRRTLFDPSAAHKCITRFGKCARTAAVALQVYCTNNIAQRFPETCTATLSVGTETLLFMRPPEASKWAFSSEGAMLESLRRIAAAGTKLPDYVWFTPVLPTRREVMLIAKDRRREEPWLATALRAAIELHAYAA